MPIFSTLFITYDTIVHTVCRILSSGIILMIDITWDPVWQELIDLLRVSNVPYIHIDISIKPFIRTFLKFTEYINTRDAAIILQNEKGKITLYLTA